MEWYTYSEGRKLEVRGLDLRLGAADLPRTATGGG